MMMMIMIMVRWMMFVIVQMKVSVTFIPQLGMVAKRFGSLALFVAQVVPVVLLRLGFAIFIPELLCPTKDGSCLLLVFWEIFPVVVIPRILPFFVL